jgi:shikimate kinase
MDSPDQNRPLIKGKNKEQIKKFLEEKLLERLPYYSKASIELSGSSITADEIMEELLRRKLF